MVPPMRQNQKTAKFKAVPTARNMMNDRQAGTRACLCCQWWVWPSPPTPGIKSKRPVHCMLAAQLCQTSKVRPGGYHRPGNRYGTAGFAVANLCLLGPFCLLQETRCSELDLSRGEVKRSCRLLNSSPPREQFHRRTSA